MAQPPRVSTKFWKGEKKIYQAGVKIGLEKNFLHKGDDWFANCLW